MFTRRALVNGALGVGASLALTTHNRSSVAAAVSPIERNKAAVRRFMQAQGTKDEAAVNRELLAPGFKWSRLPTQHLDDYARDRGLPRSGPDLHIAFPDHEYFFEETLCDGDFVSMKYCSAGTHRAAFNGIPATGRTIDLQNVSMFQFAEGKITDAWILNDEYALVEELGVKLAAGVENGLPPAPPTLGVGEDPDVLIRCLEAGPLTSKEDHNRLLIARTKGSVPFPEANYAADFRQKRAGFKHLRKYGEKTGTASENLGSALADRRDRIVDIMAEGDRVWMRFKVVGVHAKPLYGFPPTGRHVEVSEIAMMLVVDGKWKEAWYFADELSLMLQLGMVDAVLSRCIEDFCARRV
jgi:predicted ester cyclase